MKLEMQKIHGLVKEKGCTGGRLQMSANHHINVLQ